MPATTTVAKNNSGNTTPSTTQSQLAHKRWYPSLPADTHQDVVNASRFTWDNLYQLRGWTRQLALASGVALEGDSVTANAASGTSTLSSASGSASPSSGPSFTSGSQTGPSNSQIMGLNVAAMPPGNGQIPTYNAATGQIEFQGGASSAAANGYTTLPAGIIMQWGTAPDPAGSSETVTFPIKFPNACFVVNATDFYGGNARIVSVVSFTQANFIVRNDGTSNGVLWTAIGN